MRKWLSILLPMLFASIILWAQPVCNTPGQNPSTAFPVCGTSVFNQASVNLCGGRTVPNPKCSTVPLSDVNPYWYKFTCFKSGKLSFLISPNSATSDYDWQLYDVTNRNAADVYTDASMVVGANWSGYYGPTGTSATANNLLECDGNVPQFSKEPDLIEGHNYLLLVSHFSNSQAGYKLEFSGGTAVITDTANLSMKELKVGCGGTQFYLKLSKKIRCSSIAANGSDWEFVTGNVPIIGAAGVGCANGFDTDSIIITTSGPVPAGTFAIRSKKGSDGNTVLDVCNNALPDSQTLVVNVLPSVPTVIDSIRPVQCMPSTIEVVLKDNVLCSSVASNGSDFTITGPAAVSVTGAQVTCTNNVSKVIRLQLAAPIRLGGVYTVAVKQGTDGNTLTTECSQQTLVGNSQTFTAYDTVAAIINVSINSSCVTDTIRYSNPGNNGINSWQWSVKDDPTTGSLPNFTMLYTTSGVKEVTLKVSNGVCSMTGISVTDLAQIRLKAGFEYPNFACPGDSIVFTDKSTGPISTWQWDFGNGQRSAAQTPPAQLFNSSTALSSVPVRLIVGHVNGCKDTVVHRIQVPNNCFIAVPTGFTPNGDGLNDFLYPLNAWKATELHFRVYNRLGELVFETRDWTRKWDGRLNGQPVPTGTYVWMLQYTDDKGKKVFTKGTTVVIR
ncbi:gliding motility-associated C-terminal domain-containing protein [Phnomibacter sp. MR]|uniref:T9SS type B sorting domain-containing protein n=1 Tax=Phnomibacter sp. MR TaxID=3042318 RepID=UPI003A80B927